MKHKVYCVEVIEIAPDDGQGAVYEYRVFDREGNVERSGLWYGGMCSLEALLPLVIGSLAFEVQPINAREALAA
jgi:hypothetical protein